MGNGNKGFAKVTLLVVLVVIAGVAGWFVSAKYVFHLWPFGKTGSSLCTQESWEDEIGTRHWPEAKKYTGIGWLGEVFTADDCSPERLNDLTETTPGRLRGFYGWGSYAELKKKPSQELVNTLESIGYTCKQQVNKSDCMVWELENFKVEINKIIKLKPFYKEYFLRDECINCG